MSYNSSSKKLGRQPLTIFEADFDQCRHYYGTRSSNNMTWSNDLNNSSWIHTNAFSSSSYGIAPDGSNSAWRVTSNPFLNGTITHLTSSLVSSKAHTLSAYFKKDTADLFAIYIYDLDLFGGLMLSYASCRWDGLELSIGRQVSQVNGGLYNVNFVGNGWYRVEILTGNFPNSGDRIRIGIQPESGLSAINSGVLMWGSQFEETDVFFFNSSFKNPGAYIESSSVWAKASCTASTASENLIQYSEKHDFWDRTNFALVSSNVDVAPDGNTTADRVIANSSSSYQSILTSGQPGTSYNSWKDHYTASIFVKKDATPRSTRFVMLTIRFLRQSPLTLEDSSIMLDTQTGDFNTTYQSIDGFSGVVSSGNYWRIYISAKTKLDTFSYVDIVFYPARGSSSSWFESVTATGDAIVWGGQVSRGNIIRNYVKTEASKKVSNGKFCYNTFNTCQAKPSFLKIRNSIRFCDNVTNFPIDKDLFPCIRGNPKSTSAQLTPGNGLGVRSSYSVQMNDFTHNDIGKGLDRYAEYRLYNPTNQGTFFGKLIARNKYYIDRPSRSHVGYINEPFSFSDFETREYVMDAIQGPTSKGVISFKNTDILKLADDTKSKIPVASDGVLTVAITSTTTNIRVNSSALVAVYGSSGVFRIEEELVSYTGAVTTSSFTSVTRGSNGTKAKNHTVSSNVQHCVVFSSTNVVDVVSSILVNYTNIGRYQLDNIQFSIEKSLWLSNNVVNTIITEPRGVTKVLDEICIQNMVYLWWEETEQLIKLKSLSPSHLNNSVPIYDDVSNIIADSFKVTIDDRERISQVWVYYDKRNHVESNEARYYNGLYIAADLESESVNEYGSSRVKVIFANWLNSGALAAQLSGRLLARYKESIKKFVFSIDAKDSSIKLGDSVTINTEGIQSVDGSNNSHTTQVISLSQKDIGSVFSITGTTLQFDGLYGFVMASTANNYSSATASEISEGAYIAPDSGVFSNEEPAYKIV